MKSAHQWIAWIDNRTASASRTWPLGKRLCIPLVRGPLWLASLGYALATFVRNKLYDFGWLKIHRADVPVISIGNVTAGGTGKTPVVAYLAKLLRQRGLRVAIVSRGYGATAGSVNDEALVDADEIAAHPGVEDEISDTRRHSMDSPSTAK